MPHEQDTPDPTGNADTANPSGKVRRRTQEERRTATINKLTDATIETLIELGYANASTNEICRRAGVSQGALFRHFATRIDLMIHVGEEVQKRQFHDFEQRYFRQESSEARSVEDIVRLIRLVCRSRLNRAWLELAMASRTDDDLKQKMAVVYATSRQRIHETALKVRPEFAGNPEPYLAMIDGLVLMFEAEAIYSHLEQDEAAGQQRLDWAIKAFAAETTAPAHTAGR